MCSFSLESPRAKALAEVQLESLRILVVEDDLFSAEAVAELCRQCDFAVELVSSGEQCLAALETNAAQQPGASKLGGRFNLVLCDVRMHGMETFSRPPSPSLAVL